MSAWYRGDRLNWHGDPKTYKDALLECSHELDVMLSICYRPEIKTVITDNIENRVQAYGADPISWSWQVDWRTEGPTMRGVHLKYDDQGTARSVTASLKNWQFAKDRMEIAYQEVFKRATTLPRKDAGLCTLEEAAELHRFIDEVKLIEAKGG